MRWRRGREQETGQEKWSMQLSDRQAERERERRIQTQGEHKREREDRQREIALKENEKVVSIN